jgi:hypothetical protein
MRVGERPLVAHGDARECDDRGRNGRVEKSAIARAKRTHDFGDGQDHAHRGKV